MINCQKCGGTNLLFTGYKLIQPDNKLVDSLWECEDCGEIKSIRLPADICLKCGTESYTTFKAEIQGQLMTRYQCPECKNQWQVGEIQWGQLAAETDDLDGAA